MKSILLNWKRRTVTWMKTDIIRETFSDAVLYAICGLLYGIIFAGLGAQLHRNISTILTIACTGAFGGLVIGMASGLLRHAAERE